MGFSCDLCPAGRSLRKPILRSNALGIRNAHPLQPALAGEQALVCRCSINKAVLNQYRRQIVVATIPQNR